MLRRRRNWWFWNKIFDINWLYQFRIYTFFIKNLFRFYCECEKNVSCCEILYDHVKHIVSFLYRINIVASLIFYSSNDSHCDDFENCWKKIKRTSYLNISSRWIHNRMISFEIHFDQSFISLIDDWIIIKHSLQYEIFKKKECNDQSN